MRQFKIAVYPGDGIGVEVTEQAVRVLEATQRQVGRFALQMTHLPWGLAYYEKTGRVAPEDFLEQLRPFDAILLGALGWPAKVPDHISLVPIIQMRQRFDQYACVRPARLLPSVRRPLAGKTSQDIDFVVRENSEGEYVSLSGRFKPGMEEETAIETGVHTRLGVERVLRFGFELARTRRQHLTMITKSNALKHGFVMWDEVFEEVRARYPDIQSDKQHADAAAMNFVRCPELFDVVVASNLIRRHSDRSWRRDCRRAWSCTKREHQSRTQVPVDVRGARQRTGYCRKGIANPVAAILSAAMMLEFLGLREAADRIRQAVEQTLGAGLGTPDLGGQLTTEQLGEEIRRGI